MIELSAGILRKNGCKISLLCPKNVRQRRVDHFTPCIWENTRASATTLVSVRNTVVFRKAVTALAQPRTLWRRIRSDGSRCISPMWRLLYHASFSWDGSRCILRSPLRRQASFTLQPECGDLYAPSERQVCHTLRSTYVVAVYPTPCAVYSFHRPSATF
jgi:hypothetical protein